MFQFLFLYDIFNCSAVRKERKGEEREFFWWFFSVWLNFFFGCFFFRNYSLLLNRWIASGPYGAWSWAEISLKDGVHGKNSLTASLRISHESPRPQILPENLSGSTTSSKNNDRILKKAWNNKFEPENVGLTPKFQAKNQKRSE